MSFQPDIAGNTGEVTQLERDLRAALEELGVKVSEDGQGGLHADYATGSYEPIKVRFFFGDVGIAAVEGELVELGGEGSEELRVALNYLNVEVDTFRFYLRDRAIMVRHDLLPNLDRPPPFHSRELSQVLTGLCAQKAIFEGPLAQVQQGRSWRHVKDALKAFR